MHTSDRVGTKSQTVPVTKTCPVCKREVPVVNYNVVRGMQFGYLGRHWRPGIARTSKCSGSFGGWIK